ncbi:50S ribosomal protein L7ae [Fructobacillus sp. M2-14]|uniref:50S ribosomal protein L7ae n=1 Tax=Fructobacillus broussonetiae TaxID=2713173 RepID=A0ABS5QXY4_9LACO|nr:ribosomal L7Ae/L30e/S12e/Gadd45 family protein [Fructobacillus broussonetiae]MBS9338059.1 50S ribosomal protein L7ae [Fructobacillus broussonetiae]
MTMNKLMQTLGLARRANKVVLGSGPTLKAIQNQSARIVFFPKDGGASQYKKFSDKCAFYKVTFSDALTRDELISSIGMNRSVLAIEDAGFSKKIKEILEEKERN